jgi:hypothetical protein
MNYLAARNGRRTRYLTGLQVICTVTVLLARQFRLALKPRYPHEPAFEHCHLQEICGDACLDGKVDVLSHILSHLRES